MLLHLIGSFFKFGAQVVMQIRDTQLHRKAFPGAQEALFSVLTDPFGRNGLVGYI